MTVAVLLATGLVSLLRKRPFPHWFKGVVGLVALVLVLALTTGLVALATRTVGSSPGIADPHPAASHELIVLGDSYTSGEGASRLYASTDNRLDGHGNSCHQAPTAWAVQLADKYGLRLRFLACSGATTEEVLHRSQYPLPADVAPTPDDVGYQTQIAGLTSELKAAADDGRTVDEVVLGIGGNDAGFSEVLSACETGNCVKKGTELLARMPEVGTKLKATYAALVKAVKEDGGKTPPRIFVTNYPNPLGPLPANASCAPKHFGRDEYTLLSDEFIPALNQEIHEAVGTQPAITPIDLSHSLDGARICDDPGGKPLGINTLRVERTVGSHLTPVSVLHSSFHPTNAGHGYILDTVTATLGLSDAPGPLSPATGPPPADAKALCDDGPDVPLQDLRSSSGIASLDRLVPNSTACVRRIGAPWTLAPVDDNGKLTLQSLVPKSNVAKTPAVQVKAQNGPDQWIHAVVTVTASARSRLRRSVDFGVEVLLIIGLAILAIAILALLMTLATQAWRWWQARRPARSDEEKLADPGPDGLPWVFSSPTPPAGTGAADTRGPRKLGVLLVHGVGHHAPGSTLRELGDPLLTLLEDVLSPEAASRAGWSHPGFKYSFVTPLGSDAAPAHAVVNLGPDEARTELTVAESRWSDVFRPATFAEMPMWFWHTGMGVARAMARAALHAILERLESTTPKEGVSAALDVSAKRIARFLSGLALLAAAVAIVMGLAMVAIVLPILIALLVLGGLVGGISGRVKSLRATLVSSVGDAFAYEQRHLEHVAIRTQVLKDLAWLQDTQKVDRIAIVAHSLGAAITYDVFQRGTPPERVEAVFTIGSAVMLPGMPEVLEPPNGDVRPLRERPPVFWSDLRTSFDPVPVQPLPSRTGARCVRVSNQQSLLRDHTTYVKNAEQVLAPILGWVLANHGEGYASDVGEAPSAEPVPGRAEYWRRAGLLRLHRKNAGQGVLLAYIAAGMAMLAALPNGFFTNLGSHVSPWLTKHAGSIPGPIRDVVTNPSHTNGLGVTLCALVLVGACLAVASGVMAGWDGEVRERVGKLQRAPKLFAVTDLWRLWVPTLIIAIAGTASYAALRSPGITSEAHGIWVTIGASSALASIGLMLGLSFATHKNSRRAMSEGRPAQTHDVAASPPAIPAVRTPRTVRLPRYRRNRP